MKDFCEMTADEIKNYTGNIFRYSFQLHHPTKHWIAFDGEHTSTENREKTIESIIIKFKKQGYFLHNGISRTSSGNFQE